MSNGDKALEHTYVTRITDRAAQAARMTNGREAELARLEEAIIPPVHAKPAGDVAVRTQKATLIRKYEKVTFDLSKITSQQAAAEFSAENGRCRWGRFHCRKSG